LNAVDPIQRIRTCPLMLEQHRHVLCPLHRKMDDALCSIEREFRRTSIADLIDFASATNSVGRCHAQ
jgi:hypothetical protein